MFLTGWLVSMIYQSFAQIYDHLMDTDLYNQWVDYTTKHVEAGSSVLELGCGAGHVGIALQKCGYHMTGLDLSEDMLTLAREHQDESGVHFLLLQGDMTDLSDYPLYDAIICYCDSLCYLRSKDQFLQAFQQVHNHLNDGGRFLFDVHTPYKISQFDNFSYHAESEKTIFLWDSFLGEHEYSVEHHLCILQRMPSGQYERFDEFHQQMTFCSDDYISMLNQAGFSNVSLMGEFGQDLSPECERWFFEAVK